MEAVDSSPFGWFRGLLHLPRAGEAPMRAVAKLRCATRLRGAAALLLAAGAGTMRMGPAPLLCAGESASHFRRISLDPRFARV